MTAVRYHLHPHSKNGLSLLRPSRQPSTREDPRNPGSEFPRLLSHGLPKSHHRPLITIHRKARLHFFSKRGEAASEICKHGVSWVPSRMSSLIFTVVSSVRMVVGWSYRFLTAEKLQSHPKPHRILECVRVRARLGKRPRAPPPFPFCANTRATEAQRQRESAVATFALPTHSRTL